MFYNSSYLLRSTGLAKDFYTSYYYKQELQVTPLQVYEFAPIFFARDSRVKCYI